MKRTHSPFKSLKPGKKTISILVFILVITIYNLEDRDVFKPLRIFRAIEQKSMDIRFQIRGKRDTGEEIVIVTIDEKSIKQIGRYPWPRHYIAQLVDVIANAGAKVLALDVIYSEEQNIDVLRTLDRLAKKYEGSPLWNNLPESADKKEFLSTLREERERHDADSRLKEALRKAIAEKDIHGCFSTPTSSCPRKPGKT